MIDLENVDAEHLRNLLADGEEHRVFSELAWGMEGLAYMDDDDSIWVHWDIGVTTRVMLDDRQEIHG